MADYDPHDRYRKARQQQRQNAGRTTLPMWTYKGIDVHPVDAVRRAATGIRWYADMPWDNEPMLRADSKAEMRRLITETLAKHGIIRFNRRR